MKKGKLLIGFLLMFMLLLSTLAFAVDEPGAHFNDAKKNQDIKEVSFFQKLFSTFTIYPIDEPVQQGDVVEFTIEEQAWNYVHCDQAWTVVEIYKDGIYTGEAKSRFLGEINFNEFTKQSPSYSSSVLINIGENWPDGIYEAVDYMFCQIDSPETTPTGDKIDHSNTHISTPDTLFFNVQSNTDCPFTSEGWQTNTKSCVTGDIHAVNVQNLALCEYSTQLFDQCDFGCSGSSCDAGECNKDSDCGIGEICSGFFCIDRSDAGCSYNWDCPNGYECSSGNCIPKDQGDVCSVDANCDDGQECIGGVCVPETPDGKQTVPTWLWFLIGAAALVVSFIILKER